jgi:muconolactone D-isomerase
VSVARYLVQITVELPAEMPAPERQALLERERQRGLELREAGTIEDIWRLPGRLANVGVWRAPSATDLHEAISSLPVWAWTRVEVTPLADHPLTREKERDEWTDGGPR